MSEESAIETVEQAHKVLSQKLVFGNLRQIEAVKFLSAVEDAAERIRTCKRNRFTHSLEVCPTCEGTGEHECSCGDTHECNDCEGLGSDDDRHSPFNCPCVDGTYSTIIICEAMRELRRLEAERIQLEAEIAERRKRDQHTIPLKA